MANSQGSFIWYELVTAEGQAEAAADFYAAVAGWTVTPAGGDYHILKADGVDIGGLVAVPESAPMQPGWLGYLAVDDIDAAVAAIAGDGGRVLMPRHDAPGVGSMALVSDPQGAPFYIIRREGDQPNAAFDPTRNGHGAWHELATPTDPHGALAWYARHLGWTEFSTMPMGEMGDYVLFAQAGAMIGGIMGTGGDGPAPRWTYYFRVDAIDAALDRVVAAGGAVIRGPQEVPGGGFILHARDPHGRLFALTGPRENDTE